MSEDVPPVATTTTQKAIDVEDPTATAKGEMYGLTNNNQGTQRKATINKKF